MTTVTVTMMWIRFKDIMAIDFLFCVVILMAQKLHTWPLIQKPWWHDLYKKELFKTKNYSIYFKNAMQKKNVKYLKKFKAYLHFFFYTQDKHLHPATKKHFYCFYCSVEFSASLLQSSVSHDPSEIILICWFDAQETFLITINAEKSCAASYVCETVIPFLKIWNRNLL